MRVWVDRYSPKRGISGYARLRCAAIARPATTQGCGDDRLTWFDSGDWKSSCYTKNMMTNISAVVRQMSDREVLARVHDAVRDERVATARLIALLIEFDTRRLYLSEGCSSLFTYCTQVLHLSEHAAYNRIETARAARRFPVILELVESAAVTLTTVRLLAPHLTDANHRDVLERSRHKSKREVELLVATLNPCPDVPSMVRKLPTPEALKLPAAESQQVSKPDVSTSIAAAPCVSPAPRPAELNAHCAGALQNSIHSEPRNL